MRREDSTRPVRGASDGDRLACTDGALRERLPHGVALYQAFNAFSPTRVVRVRCQRLIPPMVVELGRLTGLIYRSDKGQPGEPRTYIHFMEAPPRLVSNVEGSQLYIVGGSYRVTAQGIEG